MNFIHKPSAVVLILGASAALAVAVYLMGAAWVYRLGFPLDDAWIHQTYARNLGENRAWEFLPGQTSAGSTAPAWTVLLSIGYWLKINFYLWTFTLGWLILWGSGVAGAAGFRILSPKYAKFALFAGLLVIFEWHLTWAAGSGMETLLAGLMALIVLVGSIYLVQLQRAGDGHPGWKWFGIGVLIGLSVCVRPDGITLLAVAGLSVIIGGDRLASRLKNAALLLLGVILLAGPYLIFNIVLAGEIWPNTFFAKQMEYAILREIPLWQRYFNLIQQPLTGVGIILLPGFIWYGYSRLRKKSWAEIFAFVWIPGYILIYALRLPVTYQHGRYIMPVIPVFCLLGLLGLFDLLEILGIKKIGRILRPAWLISALLVLFSFWVLGLRGYAMDVAVIESEMVATANWVAGNTGGETLVAAHDIGALGYFSGRNLVDLAGLVSPAVIPFIRDEALLADYLDEQAADYLVTFPDWYPELTSRGELIHQTGQDFSPSMGGENMAVYRWAAR